MQTLGYHPVWLERGLISPEMMLRQLRDYEAGYLYAISTEHLRYSALGAWGLYHPFPTDDEFQDVLTALRVDEDKTMAKSFLRHGLSANVQSTKQLRLIKTALREFGFGPEDEFNVEFYWRRQEGKLRQRDIHQAIELGDGGVHNCLVADSKELWILRELVEKGHNKAVRHAAKQRMQHLERQSKTDA